MRKKELDLEKAKCLLADSDKSMKEIVEALEISTSFFYREFTKLAGETPAQYRNENNQISTPNKIEKVKEDLENTRLKLNEIAKRQGFEDGLALSRIFRHTVGEPATQYRRKAWKKYGAPAVKILSDKVIKARNLMVTTEKTLTEIATASGFKNYDAMNYAFTKEVGQCPGKCRESLKEKSQEHKTPAPIITIPMPITISPEVAT